MGHTSKAGKELSVSNSLDYRSSRSESSCLSLWVLLQPQEQSMLLPGQRVGEAEKSEEENSEEWVAPLPGPSESLGPAFSVEPM